MITAALKSECDIADCDRQVIGRNSLNGERRSSIQARPESEPPNHRQ